MKNILLILAMMSVLACSKDPTGLKLWGTSDSGGGNGTENKVYESYIVDPLQLPAFKAHLQGVLENIQRQEKQYASNSTIQLTNLLTYKTWYIAPVEFETIGKGTLGVSFNKDKTQQLAIQTSKEIWIKKDLFEKMSAQEQADLIVHEFVMNLYFLKYKSISELCRLSAKSEYKAQCRMLESYDAMLPGQDPQALNAEDYQNIRRATGFFLQEGTSAGRDRMREVLAENNFDPRLFAEAIQPEEVGKSDFFKLKDFPSFFPESNSSRALDQCRFLKSRQTQNCRLKVEFAENTGFQLQVVSDEGVEYFTAHENRVSILASQKEFNPLDQSYIYLIRFSYPVLQNAKVGDQIRVHQAYAVDVLSGPMTKLEVQAVVSAPMVVSQVIERSGRRICIFDSVPAKSIYDDVAIAGRHSMAMSFAEFHAAKMNYAATCD